MPDPAPLLYRARCACGATAEGPRPRKSGPVPCPGCGRKLFAFAAPTERPRAGRSLWRAWRGPLLAAAISLGLIVSAIAYILPRLARNPAPPTTPLEAIEAKLARGEQLLGQGKFHLSRSELDEAIRLRAAAAGLLGAARGNHLNQLHRQADLLARLSPLPLEEIVRQARFERDPDEWAARWQAFKGRSILFDDAVRLDREGRPVLAGLPIIADGEEARLALEGIEVLREMPLESGPRVVFGARLESCKREEGGGWVIRFEAGSGVLMTEAAALEAACAVPLDDGVKEVLERQRKWLEERGRVAPARP